MVGFCIRQAKRIDDRQPVCVCVCVCVCGCVGVHAHRVISSQSKLCNDGGGDGYVPLCVYHCAVLCCCVPCV